MAIVIFSNDVKSLYCIQIMVDKWRETFMKYPFLRDYGFWRDCLKCM